MATTNIARQTEFSPCGKYRYSLWREWDNSPLFTAKQVIGQFEYLNVIGLNPSTADETKDDPTIRKCIGFAKRWHFGGLCMTNLFAWRDTSPEKMKQAEEPCGIDNRHHVLRCAYEAGMVLVAWGRHGRHHNQDLNVLQWLHDIGVKPVCLKLNGDGTPMHPLYVPNETKPQPFKLTTP